MPVRIHLSRLMGERKLKIADVARETDINRGTLTRLYYEKAERVDLDVLEKLCRFLECEIGDLMEIVDESGEAGPPSKNTVYRDNLRLACIT